MKRDIILILFLSNLPCFFFNVWNLLSTLQFIVYNIKAVMSVIITLYYNVGIGIAHLT